MKSLGYPYIIHSSSDIQFRNGRFCALPMEYLKESNTDILKKFYLNLLTESKAQIDQIQHGTDPLGFTYFVLDFICYIGLICPSKDKGKYRNLSKKYPDNSFSIQYVQKQIQFEYDLMKFKEYIPIEIVTQNLHEIRGLNSKIAGHIDRIMKIEDEAEWEEKFETQSESIKKIYVGSRLIKFILDNVKFYIPDFFESLRLNYDRSFIVHRSVSKIVKIYRNDFRKDHAEIHFSGTSSASIQGDKEYFEILFKIMVENALKYSEIPKNIGPKVIINETTKHVMIEVHSYGRLIPESERPFIFSKGFRSSVNKRSKEGTGMGLYNAKLLAKHFKGHIQYSYNKLSDAEDIKLAWNIFTLKIQK